MKEKQDHSSTIPGSPDVPDGSLEREISERLISEKTTADPRTIHGLLRQSGGLPLDHTRAALETSAAIAAVSIRASIEFLRATPTVAQVLDAAEVRAWGELGRRLTMADVESGVSFYVAGIGEFAQVPSLARPFVFQVCARQMILSPTTAAETFRGAPALAEKVSDPETLRSIYEVAAAISRRSAKHSAEFLNVTPEVVAALEKQSTSFRGGLPPPPPKSHGGGRPPPNQHPTHVAGRPPPYKPPSPSRGV